MAVNILHYEHFDNNLHINIEIVSNVFVYKRRWQMKATEMVWERARVEFLYVKSLQEWIEKYEPLSNSGCKYALHQYNIGWISFRATLFHLWLNIHYSFQYIC